MNQEDGGCLQELSKLFSKGSTSDGEVKIRIGKEADSYNMNHAKRGLFCIFNHYSFEKHLDKDNRSGTEVDCARLTATFKLLGFKVKMYNDLTVKEIKEKLQEIRIKDYKDCDCLAIAVLSHGTQDEIFARDGLYPKRILVEEFTLSKCPTLAGKPKILILQTCQGRRIDNGQDVYVDTDGRDSKPESYRLPSYADFLIIYSTVRGFVSYRHPQSGSWYIQALCDEIQQRWQKNDFLTILTFVNRRVAIYFEKVGHNEKQMPSFTSMLTRLLTFVPKQVTINL